MNGPNHILIKYTNYSCDLNYMEYCVKTDRTVVDGLFRLAERIVSSYDKDLRLGNLDEAKAILFMDDYGRAEKLCEIHHTMQSLYKYVESYYKRIKRLSALKSSNPDDEKAHKPELVEFAGRVFSTTIEKAKTDRRYGIFYSQKLLDMCADGLKLCDGLKD